MDGSQRTYLRDCIEHDCQEEVSAVGFLGSLGLVLEEGELALDAVPEGHLVDIVQHDDRVKDKHEVLHAVDRWQEHLLQVLCRLGCICQAHIDSVVVELE